MDVALTMVQNNLIVLLLNLKCPVESRNSCKGVSRTNSKLINPLVCGRDRYYG